MYGMASLSSTFALLLVTESSIKSKHVQKVSGVYLSNFWFSALLWDLVNFLLPCLLMLVRKERRCLGDCVSKNRKQRTGGRLIGMIFMGIKKKKKNVGVEVSTIFHPANCDLKEKTYST